MKPASRTVSYTVYPPEYMPGDGYKKARSLKAAKQAARKYGNGASVDRCITTSNKRRTVYENMVAQFVLE